LRSFIERILRTRSLPGQQEFAHAEECLMALETAINPYRKDPPMEVNLQNTTKIVTPIINGAEVPARVWEGVNKNGVRCHAFITRIAVHQDDNPAEFERELKAEKPSQGVASIFLSKIL
jgi:hypothetical protein